MDVPPIRYEVADGRADIVISRPETRNALTAAMMRELVGFVDAAGNDDDVKVIVIRSEGPHFTSGFDITDTNDFAGADDDPVRARVASLREKAGWMEAVLHAAKPTVVEVRGHCIGIGTMLVLVSDFCIASDDAGLGFPEERFGSAGATWAYPFLTLSVGLKRANELLMTGRRLPAEEAFGMGLVNRVVPSEQLEAETAELVRALVSLPRDGIAVNRATKRLLLGSLGYDACFAVHAVSHPLTERAVRTDDEYDFIRSVSERGLRDALDERNERFGGSWWGW